MNAGESRIGPGGHSAAASTMPNQRAVPKAGDVLVSTRTARADLYEISVLPTEACMTAVHYDDAMEKVRNLARGLRVDGWYTCDHTHFARIARHRT